MVRAWKRIPREIGAGGSIKIISVNRGGGNMSGIVKGVLGFDIGVSKFVTSSCSRMSQYFQFLTIPNYSFSGCS
jgi:hypothetical protein